MRGALLVAGTTSDAGKSVVTAGICRWLARQGVRVAPFKAQNMSLNSFVTADGAEIGRAQAVQAAACGLRPTADMNPILLKPGSDRRSQVVVMGRPAADVDAMEYGALRDRLRAVAVQALERLRSQYDVVICEGAGSPAEINLRAGDIANMGLAQAAGLPVIVVGDIDRGGVFASMYGTLALLDAADQALVAGFVVNKFRGARELLEPGLDMLRALTGREVYGVLPWLDGLWMDVEDSLALDGRPAQVPAAGGPSLRVAVVRLPRISNFTDMDALAAEPGVIVRFVTSAAELDDADLVVIPGSRATVADLTWLRSAGLARAVRERAARGGPVLGICGGYQMLARTIRDDVESGAGVVEGLGLLPAFVEFAADKRLGRPVGEAYGCRVAGYEIHHGSVTVDWPGHGPAGEGGSGGDGAEPFLDGCRLGAVWGTTWHGALENDDFRRAFLVEVAASAGRAFTPAPGTSFAALREARLDALGDLVERHVDTEGLTRLIRRGAPAGLPLLGPGAGSSRGSA
ncbi:cobyric acid synthase [Nonomuraea cavernae]|uniref:Cobyric acid synthase n=1 Tax=Nonomuraea cavernae TaxID=2045107 RepID=A0A918DLT2_9ACTN|nr:cobyric acid synthase [Nonomuraea cavernae]MCA2187852.1 cobyric acid synthase [Nonomuraea cavernae]GGO72049.1 cobyric acid synthase [Nonomuraea cavernae]